MKLKTFLLTALIAANAWTSHAAPVLINATTRNDTKSEATLMLAENGAAKLPIVVSAKASGATKAVAADLAGYLKKISGATFKVETGDGSKGIVLGSLAEFPNPALKDALQIVNGYDGKESYAIRTGANRLLLLGATDLGASHAAYRFLREVGCRWFFPHPAWEVVPTNKTLAFARDITDRPQIPSRVIWFEAGSGTGNAERDYIDWKRRNAQAESFRVSAGGGGMDAPFSKEIMAAHPEYWAARKQANGTLKRDASSNQYELGNPAVRKIIVDYAVNYFKANPDADMVSLEPADTTAHSQSPESLKLGSISDQVFGMANEAAKAVAKAYPGKNKMIGLLSYNAYYDPPSFSMEPNVHVQLSGLGMNPKYSGPERWKLWTQKSKNLGVYEYYSVWLWSYDKLPGSYTNAVRGSQKHIRDDLVASNILSLSAESTSSWGSNGRGYYVANALLWNPNLDLNALLQDFYSKAFGPAAPMMEKYYERLSPENDPLMSGSLLGQAFRDVDQATKAAKDRPDVLARLDQLKLYLRFVDLTWYRDNEGGKVDNNVIMNNLFRTRDYALTSWELIRQIWGGGKQPGKISSPVWMIDRRYSKEENDAAVQKEFEEAEDQADPFGGGAGALLDDPKPDPFRVVPYTRAEIEKDFQEGLARYTPRIRDNLVPRQKFSEDLVAINWPDIKPEQNNVESRQNYQGSMKYALWSTKGDALQFTTQAGDAWGYKTSWEVTDAKGKVLASGKPDEKVLVTHKIAVPAPGLYYLNYNDPGAYWTFTAKANQPHSIVLLREVTNGRVTQLLQPMYFYVPKGVKSLQYFATNPHTILGPDGTEQKKVTVANDWISIPVPPGMDGKPWQMRDATPMWFYFSNVPSYISPTPEGLLVPREIAVKDGLAVRK